MRACQICLEEEEEEEKSEFLSLSCNHAFHTECIKELRNPVCPLCREPIEREKFPWVESMIKRKRQDEEESNHTSILEMQDSVERIPFNAPGFLDCVFQHFTVGEILQERGFGNRLHQSIHHSLPLLSRIPCSMVIEVGVSLYNCFKHPANFHSDSYVPKVEVVSWFAERLATLKYSHELHEASHEVFPQERCTHLKAYAHLAVQTNLGTELLKNALKTKK
jgi:hypothetical protein